MTPLKLRILIRLAVLTDLMTTAVVAYTFWEKLGAAALVWGFGAGAAAAAVFALWFLWKESRRRDEED